MSFYFVHQLIINDDIVVFVIEAGSPGNRNIKDTHYNLFSEDFIKYVIILLQILSIEVLFKQMFVEPRCIYAQTV